jgi:acetyl-CoA/propionyl-CoA carboxylase carboxyl transferase subunit
VEIGVVDEIVAPTRTRSAIAAAVREADTGVRGRHTNIPL